MLDILQGPLYLLSYFILRLILQDSWGFFTIFYIKTEAQSCEPEFSKTAQQVSRVIQTLVHLTLKPILLSIVMSKYPF